MSRTLVYLDRDPKIASILPAGAAEATERLLVAAGLLPQWMLRLIEKPWYHRFGDWIGRQLRLPAAHLALRKRFVEDEVRAALGSGARQVLVVGAGYDTLCLRLANEFPERTFVEIDHPSTHESKRSAVEASGAGRPNLHLLAVDLERVTLPDALAGCPRWVAGATSVVVAEAVLMYLPTAAVQAFFTAVHATTDPVSRIVFTWARGAGEGRPEVPGLYGWLGLRLLQLAGEPVRWCVPDPPALASFIAPTGFRLCDEDARLDLRLRYLAPLGMADVYHAAPLELMAIAERGPNTATDPALSRTAVQG